MAYVHTLSFSRDGISITLEELMRIDAIVSPLIAKGQSVHSISVRHKDEIMLDEKTLYSYVKAGILTAKYIDLPNAVKMRPRKKKTEVKVERACRDGRSYRDFVSFMNENPDTAVVQMDSVEGLRGYGDPVLLTIHFVDAELMLAFRREANTAKSVADVVNSIYSSLGHDLFCSLFPLILTDLGPEFSNPSAIEMAPDGRKRTRLFYTDPGAPFQKGACENNHTLIRRVIPKGTPLKTFSQDDISLLMNHINSYSRKKLADKCPIDVFCFLHGASVLDAFGVTKIPPDLVTLKPSLLKN
jgi:IS30 family transposase